MDMSANHRPDRESRKRDFYGRQAHKPEVLAFDPNSIPNELQEQRRWVGWKLLWNDHKGLWDKIPVNPLTGRNAKANDPKTWGSFQRARTALVQFHLDGVGYQFAEDGCEFGIDLDHCREPVSGAIDPWAQEIIALFNTYTEVSPSGTGLKLIGLGRLPKCRKLADREAYDRGRYFTVTGRPIPGSPHEIRDCQTLIDDHFDRLFPPIHTRKPIRSAAPARDYLGDADDADKRLIVRARNAENGEKFSRLWEGNTSGYPSNSEADLALCAILGYWTKWDSVHIDQLFRHSRLMRKKWDSRRNGETYGQRTIAKALEERTEACPQANNGAPTGEPGGDAVADGIPIITIGTDEHRVNREAAAALATEPELYQRAGMLVHVVEHHADSESSSLVRRPVGSPVIRQLSTHLLRERLTHCAQWQQVVGKERRRAHPPGWSVQAVYSRREWPGVRPLEAVVAHPVLLGDGSVLTADGYHRPTRILVRLPHRLLVTVPDSPSRDEVRAAVEFLSDAVCDFPFERLEHRAAWFAGLLTPLAWFAFDGPAPLFLIDKNVRGAGAGLLADVIALIVSGRRFPIMSYTSEREELRKRITTLAVEGESMVLLDNLSGAVGNNILDAALTADRWKDRLLGGNRGFDGPLHICWYGTGNNVQLAGDTARRVLHVRMETLHERPELRTEFKHTDLRSHVRESRGRLLSAALTILRGWVVAGKPQHGLPAWGSFEGWSGVVREAVVFAGLPDPGETRQALQVAADRDAAAMTSLLSALQQMDPCGRGVTTAEIIDTIRKPADHAAEWMTDIKSAVEELCGRLDGRNLGYRFRHFQRRNFNGLMLDKANPARGSNRWVVRSLGGIRVDGDHVPHVLHHLDGGHGGDGGHDPGGSGVTEQPPGDENPHDVDGYSPAFLKRRRDVRVDIDWPPREST